jgi:CHASE1-domain containing sensor protein
MANYLGRVAILAALYVLTGKLGLLLAVPPGYATIIWPPSGIALGMLLTGGSRLWPGVFLGSFLLNAHHSGAFSDADWASARMAAAAGIALGSTLQALLGRALIARFVGLPLQLNSFGDIARLLALAGPVACVMAASVGVGTLWMAGIVTPADLARNWLAWWSGDTLGVLVFMPLVLLGPGSRNQLSWRASRIGRLPIASLLLMLLPLGLTFYLWKAATENDFQRGTAKFESLTIESEKALQNRVSSYASALLGAAGFVQGSNEVSRAEWRTYVETIGLDDNFPGISGIGWIQPVAADGMEKYLADTRADGAPGFQPHPSVPGGPNYIITFIEPEAKNRAALGLNVAFEQQRLATAQRSRDTGRAAMTGPVELLQHDNSPLGFVAMHPVYRRGAPLGTIEQRRAALQGWTYSPFIASHLLADLTHGQSSAYRLRIYDVGAARPDTLVYSSDAVPSTRPAFSKRATLGILQRQWLLVWESTEAFEVTERSANPLFILIGGLVFTALLALLLIVLTVRRTEQVEQMFGERHFAVPALVFAVLAAGSFALHWQLRAQELDFVQRRVQDETSRVEALLRTRVNERVGSLARLAERWEAATTIDENLWRMDAASHVAQLSGLRALEWIDPSYRVRWVEPLAGN